jgi:hypothetical protein
MQIAITRSKENQKTINRFRKNLKLKAPQRIIFFFAFIGLILFLYGSDGINFETFSGYSMVAMLFWGGALIVYLENFYPKLNFNAKTAIKAYHDLENITEIKIEINDEYYSAGIGNYYTRIKWNAFTGFKYYKQYILLYTIDTSNSIVVIILQNELAKEELNELYVFLKDKMPELK